MDQGFHDPIGAKCICTAESEIFRLCMSECKIFRLSNATKSFRVHSGQECFPLLRLHPEPPPPPHRIPIVFPRTTAQATFAHETFAHGMERHQL